MQANLVTQFLFDPSSVGHYEAINRYGFSFSSFNRAGLIPSGNPFERSIGVENGTYNDRDRYGLFVRPAGGPLPLGDLELQNIAIQLGDLSGEMMLLSDALPLTPPDVSLATNFAIMSFHFVSPCIYVSDVHFRSRPTTIHDVTAHLLVSDLVQNVIQINLNSGISNSLDSKLDSAMLALEDSNINNDGAARNALEAFIQSVEAQRGKQISEADADALIQAAVEAISVMN